MNTIRRRLAVLVGRNVSLALNDGSRLDDCQLVSVCRRRGLGSAWLYSGGHDVFVPIHGIIDVWEVCQPRSRAA